MLRHTIHLAVAAALSVTLPACKPPDREARVDEPGAILEITGDIATTIHLDPTVRWQDRDLDDERDINARFGRRDRLNILGYARSDTMTTGEGFTVHLTVDATNFTSRDGECTVEFEEIAHSRRTETHATLHIREARGTLTCTDLRGRHRDGQRTIDLNGMFHHRAEHERGS